MIRPNPPVMQSSYSEVWSIRVLWFNQFFSADVHSLCFWCFSWLTMCGTKLSWITDKINPSILQQSVMEYTWISACTLVVKLVFEDTFLSTLLENNIIFYSCTHTRIYCTQTFWRCSYSKVKNTAIHSQKGTDAVLCSNVTRFWNKFTSKNRI